MMNKTAKKTLEIGFQSLSTTLKREYHFKVDPQNNTFEFAGPTQGNSHGVGPNARNKHFVSIEKTKSGEIGQDLFTKIAKYQHEKRNNDYSKTNKNTTFFLNSSLKAPTISGDGSMTFDTSILEQRNTTIKNMVGKSVFGPVDSKRLETAKFIPTKYGDHHFEKK